MTDLTFVEAEHNQVNVEITTGRLPEHVAGYLCDEFWDGEEYETLRRTAFFQCRATELIVVTRKEPTMLFFNRRFTLGTSLRRVFFQLLVPNIVFHPNANCLIFVQPPAMIRVTPAKTIPDGAVSLVPGQPLFVISTLSDEPVTLKELDDAELRPATDQGKNADQSGTVDPALSAGDPG